jgi:ATP diphosphatase
MPSRSHPARRPARTRHRGRTSNAEDAFGRLVRIMAVLRSPAGCAWDLKQTHRSLRPYVIEEAYEVVDAIDRRDLASLPGELGDLLLQCVFHAQIGAESGTFDMADVIETLIAKLIRRHPHVFTPDGRRLSPAARKRMGMTWARGVVDQWRQLKAREQADRGAPVRTLAGVPRSLPALMRASRIGARVAEVGFDWPDTADVLDKVDEEVRELREAVAEGPSRMLDEFGDLLFALANVARHLKIDPEAALRQANDKFTRRFDAVEADFEARGLPLETATLAELEAAWARVKTREPRSSSSTAAPPRASRGPRARRSRR